MQNVFRYGAWDGSQHVLDLDAEALLDAMSDDLLEEGDLWRALQRLFRQGAQNQDGQRLPGLQDLMQRSVLIGRTPELGKIAIHRDDDGHYRRGHHQHGQNGKKQVNKVADILVQASFYRRAFVTVITVDFLYGRHSCTRLLRHES